MPYGSIKRMENLTAQLNMEDLAFTIHVGDIKSGSSPCTDEAYVQVKQLFDRFRKALIYTPGDNEWTDCHRTSNGSMDPLERLDKIRAIFFSHPFSLGQKPIDLFSQADIAEFEQFVENRLWHHQGITFATLHMVGSNNNLQANSQAVSEFIRRDQANRLWTAHAFDVAKANQSTAIVLAMQADTWIGNSHHIRTGFLPWMEALEKEAKTWNRPVLLIQGDSHAFKVDQPFKGSDNRHLPTITRLVVHGERNVHATLIKVDPSRTNQPFSFHILLNTKN